MRANADLPARLPEINTHCVPALVKSDLMPKKQDKEVNNL